MKMRKRVAVGFLGLYRLYPRIDGGPRLRNWYSDSILAGQSGDQILVGARFSVTFQIGPGAHPASYKMGTGSFPGVKRPKRGVDHPPYIEPRLKKE